MTIRRLFARASGKEDEECSLYLYDVIGPYYDGISAKDVATALETVKAKKALSVYVNSPGGDVFEGMAIFNLLDRFKGSVNVYVDGLAGSAASFVAMAGDKITTAQNAMWMIHDPWGFAIGNAKEMRETADMLDKIRDQILGMYSARVKGKSARDQISAWMTAETWMTADEAKERGFTDEVTEPQSGAVEDLAAFSLLDKFKNTPAALRKTARATSTRLAEAKAFAMRLRQRVAHQEQAKKPGDRNAA